MKKRAARRSMGQLRLASETLHCRRTSCLHGTPPCVVKGTYIGANNRGKAIIGPIASIEGGPFDSEQQFSNFYPRRYRQVRTRITIKSFLLILISPLGMPTAILDWEYAGWYPRTLGVCSSISTIEADAGLARVSGTYTPSSIREGIHRNVISSSPDAALVLMST